MDISNNLNNLMKEAQKMQQRMQEAQEELSQLVVEGQSGGGMVKIKMNGRHDIISVTIDPRLLEDDDIEMLQDLIAAASNDAVKKVEKASKEKISKLTAGLSIPTDFMKDEDKE
eukprot:TRINITY_DN36055_c0_g1_i1.p1 TRINITY_DN36055_c0_g1~~TRINITY_DN36055_c0_g1_i1.p1  ORF type:complete len:114 (+),score=21.01 TRINITY_DN36055_c0_g1_i1:105-446(+)